MATYHLVAFDLYGTLLDISGMAAAMSGLLGKDASALLAAWRTAQLERTWELNRLGRYEPFDRVTGWALTKVMAELGVGGDDALRAQLTEQWFTVPAHGDATAAIHTLRVSGAGVAVLSNGTPPMIERALRQADLRIGDVRSVDQIRVYKPDPRVYRLLDDLAPPSASLFVSSNAFDAEGAKRAGCTVCFIDRGGAQPEVEPDLRVSSLAELADHVAAQRAAAAAQRTAP
jgi:2-haloacid dehalogenase